MKTKLTTFNRSITKLTCFLAVAASLPLASQASSLLLRTEDEILSFAQRGGELNTTAATQSDPTEIRLGEIINSATGQSIQILCTKGTREACEVVSFYHVAGVRSPKPFKVTTLFSINKDAKYEPKLRFWATNAWLIDSENEADAMYWFLLPVGPVLTVVDTIIFPIRSLIYVGTKVPKKQHYRKARKDLYKALTTGASVEVSEKTYQSIQSLISKTEWSY